ncbi:hypothetical protein DXG01_003619 [Tephrocybe rancida]|nr:hypothetical protein DXG01_003619 [Tephrocybe rancida]
MATHDLAGLVGPDSPVYALSVRIMELEARNTPPVRDDQYSLFVEQMHGRHITCASPDQCKESLYKTLLTYRLLDLELSRVGCTRLVASPSSGLPAVVDRVKSSFKDLNDLSKILQRTQKAIAGRGKRSNTSSSPALTPTACSSRNPLLNLYTTLVQNVQKSALVHTRINFSSAALHLAYLLKGNVYLPTETAKIEEFIGSSSGSSEDQGVLDRIRSEFGASTQGCSTAMHRTLFMALAVSPVMLLLPRSYDQSAGKSAILESWIQFGSVTRPPWMVAADDALWKALLAATQGGDVVSHIGDAITTLQPYTSSSTPAWFALVSNKSSRNPPSTSRIEDIDPESGCADIQTPLDTSISLIGPADPDLPSAATPAQDTHRAPCGGATPPTLRTPSPFAPTPSSEARSTSAELPFVPIVATTENQPVRPVTPLSLETPSQDVPKDCGDVDTGALPDAETQPTTSLDPLSQLSQPAVSDTTPPFTLPSSNYEDIGSDASSDLSDVPSSPPASIHSTKNSLEQLAARRSSRAPSTKPAIPYPASSGNPRKRKKRVAHHVEQEKTPVPPKAPHNPNFIDLTLEESDNEVNDTVLTLDNTKDFVFGDVEVSYPVNSPSPVFTWLPKFHNPADLEWFYKLDAAVKRSAVNGRASPIEALSRAAFDEATSANLLDLIKAKACIHIAAGQHTDTGFTEETFNEICNLDEVTTLHDFTVTEGVRTRKGTIMDLLAASAMKPPVAISALHIPSAYDMFTKLRFASDWFVWLKVQGKAYCRATELYPVPEMRWAIASTGSAHHFWHFDANGLGTFLRVETGVKLWFIAVPKNGDFQMFMRPDVMTSFELDESNEDLWDVHVAALFSGDFLIMRAGLPHCVITPESSICTGGHFKAATTIPESVVGAYHHFVGSTSYSNTDHFPASHSILMRLLVYYQRELTMPSVGRPTNPHIPDILTWDGFLGVLYLCIYFELSSALVLWDYTDNYRAFEASIKNRTRSRSLLYWIFSNHLFVLPSGAITGLKALQSIFCSFLAHHAHTLIHYKRLAVAAKVDGFRKSMTLSDVTAAVSDCIRGGPAWPMFLADNTPHTRGTFGWHNPAYVIQRTSAPVEYDFPHLHGYVFGDIKAAANLGFNISQTVVDALVTYMVDERTTSDEEGDAKDPTTRQRSRKRARAVPLAIEAP